jgi:Ser/Thr protein kinase RdoA (MazF antagonist)
MGSLPRGGERTFFMRHDLSHSFDRAALPRHAASLWNADLSTLGPLHESSNFVCSFTSSQGQACYLRLCPASHRPAEHIAAELEFIQYLKGHDCPVAQALPSAQGRPIETFSHRDQTFHACVFEAAPGSADTWQTDPAANLRILFDQGQALGRIHALSLRFRPKQRRFQWSDDGFLKFIGPHLPDSQGDVRREIASVLPWLEALPRTETTYGLIHGDFGLLNYRRDGDRLTAFDFDDCVYHFYAFDIAVALRPATLLPPPLRREYLEQFLKGYAIQRPAAEVSREQLTRFTRLSNLCRYLDLIRNWDLVSLTDAEKRELEFRHRAAVTAFEW